MYGGTDAISGGCSGRRCPSGNAEVGGLWGGGTFSMVGGPLMWKPLGDGIGACLARGPVNMTRCLPLSQGHPAQATHHHRWRTALLSPAVLNSYPRRTETNR